MSVSGSWAVVGVNALLCSTPDFRTIRLAGQGCGLAPSSDRVGGVNGAFAPMPSRSRRVYHPGEIDPLSPIRCTELARPRQRHQRGVAGAVRRCARNASDHHLRGMRRAPPSRTASDRAGSHLDCVPQLRVAAASGARRCEHLTDHGSCSPALPDSVRVGGRRRLPHRLINVAPSGAPSSAALEQEAEGKPIAGGPHDGT